MKANVYDFDKTILQKDSSVEFYKFCLKKKPSILKYIFYQLFFFVLYVFSIIDKTTFKSHIFIFLKSFDDIDSLLKEFWEKNKQYVNDWYKEKHQDTDIIISASPYFLLKPMCDELGIKNLIASDVDSKTGKFLRANCYGKEKVNRLKEFGEVEIGDFYSDSKSDQPLADLATKAYLVKKSGIYKWDEYKPTLKEKIKSHFFTKEFLAFLAVGAINTFNGILLSYLFSFLLSPIPAFFVGYLISLTISYFLNSLFVFKSKLHILKYLKFCVSYIPNFLIQNGLILIFYYQCHFNKLLVYTLAAIIAIPVTFLILSLITFAKGDNKDSSFQEWKKKTPVSSICFHIASLIIITIAFDLLISSALFIVKLGISWYQFPLSFILACVAFYSIKGKKDRLSFVIASASALVIFVGFIILCGYLYDCSYDGNAYHKLGVGLLKYGWNPMYEVPTADTAKRILGHEVSIASWVEGYCKGTWIFGSSIYAITGNIETAKCYNILLLVAVFLAAFGVFDRKIKNKVVSLALSFVAAFNPVLTTQLFTFYIDGALYAALFLLTIYLFVWLLDAEFDQKYIFLLIGSSMVICGNIKFTGLLFGGVFCIVNFLVFAARKYLVDKKNGVTKGYIKSLLPVFITFAVIAIITVCWAGSNAYVTNVLRHKTIGYPLTGKDAIDIMTPNSPFTPDSNSFVNLFKSLFGKGENFTYVSGKDVTLKIPFTFDKEELKTAMLSCDLRVGGFGPLFSGVLVLLVVVFVLECFKSKKSFETLLLFVNFLVCVVFTFAIKESWWARYAAYTYIAVILVLYSALKDCNYKSVSFIIAALALAALFVNDAFHLASLHHVINDSLEIAKDFAEMKKITKDIYAYNAIFPGSYFNLLDQGFNYVVDENIIERYGFAYVGKLGIIWVAR